LKIADEHGTGPMRNSDFDIFLSIKVPSHAVQCQNVNINA